MRKVAKLAVATGVAATGDCPNRHAITLLSADGELA